MDWPSHYWLKQSQGEADPGVQRARRRLSPLPPPVLASQKPDPRQSNQGGLSPSHGDQEDGSPLGDHQLLIRRQKLAEHRAEADIVGFTRPLLCVPSVGLSMAHSLEDRRCVVLAARGDGERGRRHFILTTGCGNDSLGGCVLVQDFKTMRNKRNVGLR